MSRRGNHSVRCERCHMHESVCVCAIIPAPRLETRTRVVLFIHYFEDRKPTNTGRLAAECLANSEVFVRGREDERTPPFVCDPSSQPLFLFPSPDAVPITRFASAARPVTLIVPDGTWRQAARVRRRVAGMADIPCVTLPAGAASSYRLRAETEVGRLATMEAIARALGVLEGPHVRQALEQVFRALVERTLWVRGLLDEGEVEAGIPEGAMRHDPSSGRVGAAARALREGPW